MYGDTTRQVYSREVGADWFPDDFNRIKLPNFPFEPDTFQKQGFYLLDKHNSLFVAAHTSSGKTLLAHFCIWKALKNGTRVIYTSPIKALSNQKYYEFRQRYADYNNTVGIITGDVQINEDAQILIMTTEILRNKLYKGDVEGLEYVIFDEVHYLNDKERGVVWEECIIQLDRDVTLLFLSATVSNALEFSEWVGRIKDRTIYVIKTDKRVVPLKYVLFKNEEFFDINGKALEPKEKGEKMATTTQNKPSSSKNMKQKNVRREFSLELFLRQIKTNSLPTIFFCFSKKKCEEYLNACSSVSYNNMHDRQKIEKFMKENSLDSSFKKYWYKGMAVHHSGLLPSEKETVEMLFANNLIKILFATETMAMGLNMPAKSVVFLSPFKKGRKLTTTEMLQMSGRAGRRGLDTEGKVYVNYEKLNCEELKKIIYGKPAPLASAFRLTFNLILMLIKSNFQAHEYMQRSFGELYTQRLAKDRVEKLDMLEKKLEDMQCYSDSTARKYVETMFSINTKDLLAAATWIIDFNGNFGYIEKIKNDEIILKNESVGICNVFCAPFLSDPQQSNKRVLNVRDVFLMGNSAGISWQEAINYLKGFEAKNNLVYIKQHKAVKGVEELQNLSVSLLARYEKNDLIDILKREANAFCSERERDRLRDITSSKNLIFGTEYEQRIKFLEDKKYIESNRLLIKGQVASEIRTLNDIIVTEMLFSNEFNDMKGEEVLAIFSCMVSNERENVQVAKKSNDIKLKYSEEVGECMSLEDKNVDFGFLDALERYEHAYSKELIEYGISEGVELNYSAIKPVYLWCKGYALNTCVANSISKGGFVRVILRLHESIREMKFVCQHIENNNLYNKLEQLEKTILRDVVVEQSLYLTNHAQLESVVRNNTHSS